MTTEKITSFKKFLDKQQPVTLDGLRESIAEWRQHKKCRSEKVPNNIWDMIFKLIETVPIFKVLGALNITRT